MVLLQVAAQIGVDEDTVYRWESNATRPPVQFIPAIIKLLGYNPFPVPERLPEKLVLYRQVLGLSQRELARRIGADPKALGLAERGKRPLSKKILKFLG
jgi:transcriptional regulator with XRE-family HTH domain